VLSTSGPRHSN